MASGSICQCSSTKSVRCLAASSAGRRSGWSKSMGKKGAHTLPSLARYGRRRLLSAHIGEHFVGIKEVSRKAAVALEGLHQGRDFVNRSNMIAKAFLIVGGEVDQVKFPHRLIIPPIKPFSRSLV